MGILDGIFKDKDNHSDKEIEALNLIIKEKELEIQKLKIEINTMRETYMSPKQLELLEKNLKSLREENNRLKKEKEEMNEKIKSLEKNSEKKEEIKSFSLDKFSYKLSVEDFFSAAKFNFVKEFLAGQNILFVQDMENIVSSPDFAKVKNSAAAVKKYSAFHKNKEVAWDNRVQLCKGDRIQKVFKKSRKFVNYLSDNNIEFMDDMTDFNFDELAVKGGFTRAMVSELKNMTDEYFKTYKTV